MALSIGLASPLVVLASRGRKPLLALGFAVSTPSWINARRAGDCTSRQAQLLPSPKVVGGGKRPYQPAFVLMCLRSGQFQSSNSDLRPFVLAAEGGGRKSHPLPPIQACLLHRSLGADAFVPEAAVINSLNFSKHPTAPDTSVERQDSQGWYYWVKNGPGVGG